MGIPSHDPLGGSIHPRRKNFLGRGVFTVFTLLVLASSMGCKPPSVGAPPADGPASRTPSLVRPTLAALPEQALTPAPAGGETPPFATSMPGEAVAAPPVDKAVAALRGLPINEFFEESYKQLLLRDPQKITELGLAQAYGLRNDRLNDLSEAYLADTRRLQSEILELLRAYDRQSLDPDERLSYDVYAWYLEALVRGHPFALYDYPLNHMLDSYQFIIEQLFVELHPMRDKADAEDYVSRLAQVNRQVDQLMEGLVLRQGAGLLPPRFIIQLAREDIHRRLASRSRDPGQINPVYLTVFENFSRKLDGIPGLSEGEKEELRQAALAEMRSSFIPAHLKLLDYLDEIELQASDDPGLLRFPDGDEYYAYLLGLETTTSLTADQVHQIGLDEVKRIKAEMRAIFDELGYPQDADWGELIGRAYDGAGYLPTSSQAEKERVLAIFRNLLSEMETNLEPAFDIFPTAQVEIVAEEFSGPAYYVPGSLDGSRRGAFHVSLGGQGIAMFGMPTVTYHEAIPGHHFQIAIAQEQDLPLFRNDIVLTGYAEGWALYAERLAWELGMYQDDPYGDLGRLQYELLRAVRLVADTGIHAKGWSRQEAKSYLANELGMPGFASEVDRYVVMPAQATGYKIGMLKILELRGMAMDELGDDFDLKEFHRLVLGHGSLPLELLEGLVREYIKSEQSDNG